MLGINEGNIEPSTYSFYKLILSYMFQIWNSRKKKGLSWKINFKFLETIIKTFQIKSGELLQVHLSLTLRINSAKLYSGKKTHPNTKQSIQSTPLIKKGIIPPLTHPAASVIVNPS